MAVRGICGRESCESVFIVVVVGDVVFKVSRFLNVCVRTCVRACVRACVCVLERVVAACVRACVLSCASVFVCLCLCLRNPDRMFVCLSVRPFHCPSDCLPAVFTGVRSPYL